MKLTALFLALLALFACRRSDLLTNDSSDLQGVGHLKRLATSGKLLALTVGQRDSISLVQGLSAAERASLFVTTENQELAQGAGDLRPLPLSFLPLKPQGTLETTTEVQEFQKSGGGLRQKALQLAQAFSQDPCTGQRWIPVHPDTHKQHPLLDAVRPSGAAARPSGIEAYRSMSRSLFVVNTTRPELPTLFSVKMGTDTVNGQQQPKLLGLQEEVSLVNHLTRHTAVPHLMDRFGVTFIHDAVGINVHKKGASLTDDSQNYGYLLRDYTPMLSDRDYVYLPLDTFKWKRRLLPGNVFVWKLDDQVELRMTAEHLRRYVNDLAYEMGKIQAIFLANGVAHDSFHGQNALVGIPLDPGNHARLGIRDVGDTIDLLPMLKSGRGRPEMRVTDINICQVLRGLPGIGGQCLEDADQSRMAGFRQVAETIGFAVPLDRPGARSTTVDDIYEWAEQSANWQALTAQVERIRVSGQSQAAVSGRPLASPRACAMASRQGMRRCMGQVGMKAQ